MNEPKPTSAPVLSRHQARLRTIGILMLVLGLIGAGLVYWLGTRSQPTNDDLSMVGYNKPQRRQMEMLYGKMGTVIEDLTDDLKRPGTQAALIAGISTVLACGCFYLARPLGADGEEHR